MSLQPSSGSLHAKVIRACTAHAQCPLECPERKVEDLGKIASFDNTPFLERIKETLWRHSSRP